MLLVLVFGICFFVNENIAVIPVRAVCPALCQGWLHPCASALGGYSTLPLLQRPNHWR